MNLRKAAWAGTCIECKGEIKKGELILSEKGIGSYHEIRHYPVCQKPTVETPLKNSEKKPGGRL